jgi:hypothetical protein
MSANCHQRKQELLTRLAESRVEMLDGVERITSRVETSLDWLGNVRSGITRHPGIWIGGSLVSSLLAIKILSGLFGHRRRCCGASAEEPRRRGLLSGALSGTVNLLIMTALPSLRTFVQEFVRNKMSAWIKER